MKMTMKLLAILIFANMAICAEKVFGQADDEVAQAPSSETLAFQLPLWKTVHFDDAAKANQHLETIKKLGCEVKQGNHAGHVDVSYRCTEWKTLAVKDQQLANQWSGWLKTSGFDVSHGHSDPAFATGSETVEFRLVQWKRIHGNGSQQEAKMIDQIKKVGAELLIESHGNHNDIRYRAPTWRNIRVADRGTADQWMAWLKQAGFETRLKQ